MRRGTPGMLWLRGRRWGEKSRGTVHRAPSKEKEEVNMPSKATFKFLSHAFFSVTSPAGKVVITDPWIKAKPLCRE